MATLTICGRCNTNVRERPGAYCSSCRQEYYRGKNSYNRAYYAKNREHMLKTARNATYLRRYGITHDEYDEMFASQDGKCAVCGGTQSKRLAVDHDHETGKVRGLLCTSCNTSIGLLNDDPNLVRLLAVYIEESR